MCPSFRLYYNHMLADGGANVTPLLEGEPIHLAIGTNVISWRMPNWFRNLLNATGSSCDVLSAVIFLLES